ncbi:MAG: heme-binding beta-barrel domain-containing protein [Acidobacteriota bacterium]
MEEAVILAGFFDATVLAAQGIPVAGCVIGFLFYVVQYKGRSRMKQTLVLLLLIPTVLGAAQGPRPDVWAPVRFLDGVWEGQGDGMSGVSSVAQTYEFVLDANFLRMTTKAVFKPQEKNPKGETHEDVGYISYDRARKAFIMRGFYAEGFVNQYVGTVSDDGKTLTFDTEDVENAPAGTKARLVFVRTGDRDLEQSFHVAWPGKEYTCYSTNRLTRR